MAASKPQNTAEIMMWGMGPDALPPVMSHVRPRITLGVMLGLAILSLGIGALRWGHIQQFPLVFAVGCSGMIAGAVCVALTEQRE